MSAAASGFCGAFASATVKNEIDVHWQINIYIAQYYKNDIKIMRCFVLDKYMGGDVKIFGFVFSCVFIFGLFVAGEMRAETLEPCRKFKIVFEANVARVPNPVYFYGVKIGKVDMPKGSDTLSREIEVCIKKGYEDKFEKNAIACIWGEQIFIFSLWPSGIILQENESMKGFVDILSALYFELKMIPGILQEVLSGLMPKFMNDFLRDHFGVKVSAAYNAMVK